MAVHVDELHTDVMRSTSNGASSTDHSEADRERLGAVEQQWQESQCLAERLAYRVHAEGFDD